MNGSTALLPVICSTEAVNYRAARARRALFRWELSVALPASPGVGGRNQQFVLFCAAELARRDQSATVFSAGSDGIDGGSNAAGAICDERTKETAMALGVDIDEELARFNASPALALLDALVVTGRTGNNLRDIRCLYTDAKPRAGTGGYEPGHGCLKA